MTDPIDQYLSLRAGAHAVKGWIQMIYDWDWAGADVSFQRARSLEPGRGVVEAAQLAAALGRSDEAMSLAQHAVELDPLSSQAHFTLAFVTYYAGRPEEAASEFHELLELNPELPNVRRTGRLLFIPASDIVTSWCGRRYRRELDSSFSS
jgi:tetratricopeptide (TPR) repeat protein